MTLHISQFVVELLVPLGEAPPPPPPVTPTVEAVRFDTGLGTPWYIVAQITDSGDNLRDKTEKAFVATGKMTVPKFSVYSYGPQKSINVSDLEDGINSNTGKLALRTTTQVQRTARKPINVANSMLWTVRLEGIGDNSNDAMKDRVDEMVIEVAQQGVRR